MLALQVLIMSAVVVLVQGQASTFDTTDITFTDQDNSSSNNDPTEDPTSTPSTPKPNVRPPRRPVLCNPRRFLLPDFPDSMYKQFMIYYNFNDYRWIILFAIAFVGNTIAFLGNVKRCRSSSPHFYMTVLAIVNTIYLAFVEGYGPLLRSGVNLGSAGCKIYLYLSEVFTMLSVWIVVCVTIERLIVVRFPLKAPVLCTWGRAVKTVCLLILVILILNIHILVGARHHPPTATRAISKCLMDNTVYNSILQFDIIFKQVMLSYIPIIVLSFCNIVIIVAVRTSSALKKDMAGSEGNQASNQGNQVTLMLLLVSITFVVLTIPPMVIRQTVQINTATAFFEYTCEAYFEKVIAVTASRYLLRLNSCLNGYLYCMSSSRFRRDLIAIVCPCRRDEKAKTTSGATKSTKLSTISSPGGKD